MTTDGVADLRALMLCAGWDVQPGGRVLCPVRGAFASLSPDRRRVLVRLPSGTRTVVEVGRRVRLVRPPSVRVGDVTLTSWDAGWLRRADVRVRAAAVVAGVGSSRGVVSLVSPYLNQVGVRVEGVTVIESQARAGEPFSVRVEDDPVRRSSSGGLGRLLFMTAMALTTGARD